MSRFRMSRAGGDRWEPWFRVGTVDVTTTVFVTALSVVSLFVFAFDGVSKPITSALVLIPDSVLHGQVWRVLTWPFGWYSISIFSALEIFLFFWFGSQLEQILGRFRMLTYLIGCTLVLAVVALALSPFVPGVLGELRSLEFIVLLTFIAQHPQARFFFNIPAWVIGLIFVGIQVLGYVAQRDWFGLISLLIGLLLCALVARAVGLLEEVKWLPAVNLPRRRGGPSRARSQAQHPSSGGRSGRTPGRSPGRGVGTVVSGPWDQPPASPDQVRMDQLLDKIHAGGMDSLSEAERAELLTLRERLRGS